MVAVLPLALVACGHHDAPAKHASRMRLELEVVDDNSAYMASVAARVNSSSDRSFDRVKVGSETWPDDAGGQHRDTFLEGFDHDGTPGRAQLEAYMHDLAANEPSLAVPAGHAIAFGPNAMGPSSGVWRTFYVATPPALDISTLVVAAEVSHDPHLDLDVAIVHLDDAGTRALAELTTRIRGHVLAIAVDGVIAYAPTISSPITDGALRVVLGLDAHTAAHDVRAFVAALTASP
jgi:hypothetical protein